LDIMNRNFWRLTLSGKVQKVFPFADIVSVARKDDGVGFGVLISFKATRT